MAIQLSDMMAGTLNCARNVATVRPGEEVLILADTTTDPEIAEAYKIAYESEGARVSVLTVKGDGAGCSSEQITHNTLYALFPKIALEAAKGSDLCINLTGYADMHGLYGTGYARYGLEPGDLWDKFKTRMLSVAISNKEALCSDWATYPQPLLKYLNFKTHEHLAQAVSGDYEHAEVHITDPQGTDLRLQGFKMCTRGDICDNTTSPIGTFGTEQVGMIPHYPTANAEGVIVSTSIHTGYIPEIRATVKGGRFVALEGGGEVSTVWMRDWKKCKDVSSEGRHTTFGVPPGPGNDWFEELMYGVHPRAFRIGYKYRYEGSNTFHAWVGGTRRSGVVHFGIGGGVNEDYRHRDFEVFHPTMTVNGVTLIDRGHLTVLDAPEVREEAAKYGDPDVLLTEKWVPEMPPAD